jgi:hypothetical protein
MPAHDLPHQLMVLAEWRRTRGAIGHLRPHHHDHARWPHGNRRLGQGGAGADEVECPWSRW